MKIRNLFILTLALTLFAGSRLALAADDLTLNLIAVNASETDPKDIDVKYLLPKELEPNDVLDTGELKVEDDVDKSAYYVQGSFNFKPKESRTFKIKVKDVWVITPEEIDILKKNMNGAISLITKPDVKEAAERAKGKLEEQLDFILSRQQSYSDNIDRRIEQYRAYAEMLEDIRRKIYDPNFFEKDAKAFDANESAATIKLVLNVTNPDQEAKKTIKQKHYLPSEVHDEDVIEKQGFEVRYDDKKGKSYLTKEEEFEPGETKKYEIVLKDIWRFPVEVLDPLSVRAKTAYEEIKSSAYESSGQFLFDSIENYVQLIKDSQGLPTSTEQHIGIYRVNEKRYEKIKQDIERLEQMLAVVRAKRLEQLEENKVKNILKKLQALRGLQALSEALFKKGISVTTTWRIIFGTIIFIAFFTALHFFIWARRSKNMGEDMGPKDGEGIKVVPKPGAGQTKEA